MRQLIIDIDGPSGSGKSSTARGVAQRINGAYLDTGSLYRAIAWRCLEDGIIDDPEACLARAQQVQLDVGTDPAAPRIAVDGQDITEEIHSPRISVVVSKVATIQPIRDLLTAQMRQIIAAKAPIVLEGRDTTTVICPEAPVRVLLVADPSARMARRDAQLGNGAISKEELADQIIRRDRDDSTVAKFQTPAPGVTQIDSTFLSLEEVIEQVLALIPEDFR